MAILWNNNCIASFTQQIIISYCYRGVASGWFKKEVKAQIHSTMSNDVLLDKCLLISPPKKERKKQQSW